MTGENFPFTELQLAWLDALESGEYKQGEGCLRQEVASGEFEYCCLGVAAELMGGEWERDYHMEPFKLKGSNLLSSLPYEMWLELKLYHNQGGVAAGQSEARKSLAYLNDSGYSFKEIAALLRTNPEKYFSNLYDKEN